MADVELHPAVAALAAALVVDDGRPGFPPAALAEFRRSAEALGTSAAPVLVQHLLAFAFKAKRLGVVDEDFLGVIAGLVLDRLGSAEAATDAFRSAGFKDAAAVVGRVEATRAPLAAPSPSTAPPVSVKRGLKRD